ncbi:hypothetical protein QJS10_CPA08g01067 [Acorus calamus]|uniref:Protein kinase domain-containing protein n=1 Tax=Acorus calamus TaxID=4465 RepID=A0AAV9E803_ACOCL|nr:hypothetical protein QJS10_CPA08g01067 [Acorus calamus]
MGLHCEGVACGCLAMSCFGLDGFGHWLLDLSGVVEICRNERGRVVVENDRTYCGVFVSPEVFVALNDTRTVPSLGRGADVWALACVLVASLIGDGFVEELFRGFYLMVLTKADREREECLAEYEVWLEVVVSELGGFSLGTEFEELKRMLCKCLNYDPGSRPQLRELWKCMRRLISRSFDEDPAGLDVPDSVGGDSVKCLVFCDICSSKQQAEFDLQSSDGGALERGPTCEEDTGNCNLVKGMSGGALRFVTLEGHRDSVSGLAVGGGYLFSSSYDKTIHVWSLQDFSHVETLKGHEHRVTAVVVSEANKPLCISGDSGSGIFVWDIDDGGFLDKKPLKNWYDHNDWRYSGVHSLAVSGLERLYSGSGDKTIKAWSLQDYSLICTMSGHKSAVSSLTICDNVLYSGSWDGTVRLWWLHDHTPLAVLEDDTLGNVSPVLSLSVSCGFIVASHESGCLKIWKNAVIVSSTQSQSGAIFALHMDGKWLFFGGWEKIVAIQELSEDELQIESRLVGSIACDAVITCLLYYNGKLFVGFADKDIKVCRCIITSLMRMLQMPVLYLYRLIDGGNAISNV